MTKTKKKTIFIIGYSITILGTGFVYPLTAIYISRIPGFDLSTVGWYFSILACLSMVVAPFVGNSSDKFGEAPFAMAGIGFQTVGFILLAFASNLPMMILAACIIGIGNGSFFGVQTPLFIRIFSEKELGSIYGLQYMIMNIAIALAGLASSFIVASLGFAAFKIAFILNACTFIVYGICLAYLLSASEGSKRNLDQNKNVTAETPFAWFDPFKNKGFLSVILLQLIFTAFAFSQMESVIPLIVTDQGVLDIRIIGIYLAVNGVVVIILQPLANRIVESIGLIRSLFVAVLFWLASFLVIGLGLEISNDQVVLTLLILSFAVLFAVAEVFVSPSLQPLAVKLAPSNRVGAYTSLVSTMYSVGLMIGPPVSLFVLSFFGSLAVWIIIVAALIATLLLIRNASNSLDKNESEDLGSDKKLSR